MTAAPRERRRRPRSEDPAGDAFDGETRHARHVWTAHPAREHPGRAVAGLALVAALAAATAAVGGHTAWGIVAAVVLVCSLSRFFFPSRFELDAEGIVARYPLSVRRARWDELRRFDHDGEAGVLRRRARPSRFERGAIPLDFGPEPAPAIEAIERHLAAPAGPPTADPAVPVEVAS